MASTGYNLNHLQAAAVGATPTYIDILYATTLEATIEQDQEYLSADGGRKVSAYSAPEGSGSLGFGSVNHTLMALLTGGTASTSGTAGTVINRLELKGSATPPAVILSAWIPNVDSNSPMAGLRLTIPSAKVAVPSTSLEQESWTEMTADLTFVGSGTGDVMMIWEELATAPTFTAGVMPTNLTAPA